MSAESDVQKPTGLSELPHLPVEAIQAELERILGSPEFKGSAMLRDMLQFVVEKTLAGSAGEIKGYTIATQVLGRNADFDGNKDPIVRILGGRLRRALEHYYLTRGSKDLIRIDIPKGTYVPSFHNSSTLAGKTALASIESSLTLPVGADRGRSALTQSLG